MAIQTGLTFNPRRVPAVSHFGVPVVSQCKLIVLFVCPGVPVHDLFRAYEAISTLRKDFRNSCFDWDTGTPNSSGGELGSYV
jgi:hypothetical protein